MGRPNLKSNVQLRLYRLSNDVQIVIADEDDDDGEDDNDGDDDDDVENG